jgi:2,5-furandicarboxylate decarboxylase 1
VANPSLGDFLLAWEQQHPEDVLRLADDTSVDYVPTALALALEARGRYPVIVVERPRGFDVPLVANVFASWDRVAGVLGVARADFNQAWLAAEARAMPPVIVEAGPVHELVQIGEQVDLTELPLPIHFEGDGGRYISAGILVANDPDTGIRNLSFQRLQLKGPRRLGPSLHSRGHLWDYFLRQEARGQPLEVAVVVGAHPAFEMAATARVGIDVDEYDIAGGILGQPAELVKCATIDVDVPATAELVIEGRILPFAREPEGPFGEFPGYSTSRSTENVFEVTALTRRRRPYFLDVVPGDSSDHLVLCRLFREPHLFQRLKAVVPGLKALHLPKSGTTFHCFFSMKKTAEGQPRSAMMLLFGLEPNIKLAVAVDEDIDVYDSEQVLWAMATRFQADRDLFTVPRTFCNRLDPSSEDGLSCRMGVDATAPLVWDATRLTLPDHALAAARELAARLG